MELFPGVHLVASGSGGFDLSDPFDCHVYLVDGAAEAALIDSGIGADVEATLARVEAAGVELGALRYVLLTHGHPDHSGGCAEIARRLPSVSVVASPSVARWVASGDRRALSIERGEAAGFYPAGYEFRPCSVDGTLQEGHDVDVGELKLQVIETPGHAAGHVCFRLEAEDRRALFCGDLLFYGGRISLEHNWDCDLHDYAASLAKLDGLGIDALLPGHHSVSLARGQRHIDSANRQLQRGFIPKSVV